MEEPVRRIVDEGGFLGKQAEMAVLWKINGIMTTVPIPNQLSDLAGWAERYLDDKVVLTSRSFPRANDIREYQNVRGVYIVMLLLRSRHDMLFSPSEENATYFREQLMEQKMRCEPTARGMGTSSARNRMRGLCVYFCDETKTQRIVVGSLPFHL